MGCFWGHAWSLWENCPISIMDYEYKDNKLDQKRRAAEGQKRTCSRCGITVLRKIGEKE